MTANDYVSSIYENDGIPGLLFARGILVEDRDGRQLLSDNAHDEDMAFVNSLLMNCGMGYVSDQNGDNEILIKDVSIKNMVRLFSQTERIGFASCFKPEEPARFCHDKYAPKVPLCILEPYVACYVKAISACSVATTFSCDGNHGNGGKIIVLHKNLSGVWHEFIWNQEVIPRFGETPAIWEGIPFTAETQYETYYRIYQISKHLYEKREELRDFRNEVLRKISRIAKERDNGDFEAVLEEALKGGDSI